jgi:hypothetical protein
MKIIYPILLVVAFCVCPITPEAVATTIQEIEQLPFDEAYRLWLHEQQAMVQQLPVMLSGSTDSKTGKFTPTSFWALACRLGRDAHTHESFLVSALTTNEYVSMVLETSSQLCTRYGIKSQASVLFDPERGYSQPLQAFLVGPKERRSLWMNAIMRPMAQPDGPTNRSQPIRPETNRPPAGAGYGR